MLFRESTDLIKVDLVGCLVYAVMNSVKPFSRLVRRRAMSEMAACSKRQAENGVAWLDQRHEGALIGLRSGVGLDIGEIATEQLFRP